MDYRLITTERQFKDCTAMGRKDFLELCKDINIWYEEKYGKTYENYILENVTEPPKFSTLNDALFFVLFQKKNDLIYGSLGATFKMDGSSAHLNYNKFNTMLENVLKKKG